MRAYFFASLFVFAIFQPANSRTESGKSTGEIVFDDAVRVWKDAGLFFLAPLHFDGKAWLSTGVVVGGTAGLFALDESARTLVLRNHSSTGDRLSGIGEQYGREIYGLSLSGGLYLGGLALHDTSLRKTGRMLLESIMFAGVTTTVIKSLVGRGRPYLGEGNGQFKSLTIDNDYESLPSGHCTVAFSVASVLAGRIDNIYATIGLYSLATLTAYSRIYDNEHWLSDTFFGAAIGTFTGIWVAGLDSSGESQSSLTLVPTMNGLCVTYTFH